MEGGNVVCRVVEVIGGALAGLLEAVVVSARIVLGLGCSHDALQVSIYEWFDSLPLWAVSSVPC